MLNIFTFLRFIDSLVVSSEDRKEGEREKEGEKHAAKVVMKGTRTRVTLSGQSLLCGMMHLDHLASERTPKKCFLLSIFAPT